MSGNGHYKVEDDSWRLFFFLRFVAIDPRNTAATMPRLAVRDGL
jgi:hypothetical protein